MSAQHEKIFLSGATIVVLVLVSFPFLLAAQGAGLDYEFGGFLTNPLDGNSYLAKMYIGWRGDWRFTLPYTADQGAGAYLFTLYILLGHLARWTGLSLILTFHAARILSSLILSFALYGFLKAYLSEIRTARLAMLFASFGSGLGWMALPFGVFTSDFWVAEAYPFLSCYTNPHFPLSLALILILLRPNSGSDQKRSLRLASGVVVLLMSSALAAMSPFGVVIVLIVWSGAAVWAWLRKDRSGTIVRPAWIIERLVWVGLGGVPILLYQLINIRADALLAGWNAQNVTPAPPVWDVLVALSPLILLCPFGLRAFQKHGARPRLLVVWILLGLVLLAIPFSLQRRFIVGLYVPVAALASLALDVKVEEARRFWMRGLVLLLLIIPTNLLIIQAALHGIRVKDSQLYLARDEADALDWIEAGTPPDALILSSPEMGLFIPAHTGRRVLYGHPYETVHAEEQKRTVERFFRGELLPDELPSQADFIFYGPREMEYGVNPALESLNVAYRNDQVIIYRAK